MASRVCVRIRKGINHCSQMAMASGTVPAGTSAALATSTDISSVSDLISQLNNSVALCLAADQAVKPTTLHLPRPWGGDAFACMRHVLSSAYPPRYTLALIAAHACTHIHTELVSKLTMP